MKRAIAAMAAQATAAQHAAAAAVRRIEATAARLGGASRRTGRALGRLALFVRDMPGPGALFLKWSLQIAGSFQREIDERRLFLWTPVATGAGVVLYFDAEREPALAWTASACVALCALAVLARRRRALFGALVFVAAAFAGFVCAGVRTALVAAPTVERTRIATLQGFVEEADPRTRGGRFLLRVVQADGLDPRHTPFRVRLTSRRPLEFSAGDFITAKARLMPPARADMPGGYDFARDAFFARIGAVGSVLGGVQASPAPGPAPLSLRLYAILDRGRNALAARINTTLSDPAASVAVAMVTGKRDFLGDATKEVIRQAGIFHIITISGIQMTLVGGVFFWIVYHLLALSPTLALTRPIKTWAAVSAMLVASLYDVATGSRIGTQRALFMTLIMFGAMICGRRAFSMRNLALASCCVLILEPEAILGASFQLSFAAVAALVVAQETRSSRRAQRAADASLLDRRDRLLSILDKVRHGPGRTLFSTACATSATASFMAYDFHEVSPYVLIGNPLTLIVIEMFAIPAALIGALLYPLGLDAYVWRYIGAGIDFILWTASWLAVAPGASVPVVAFSPWALCSLTLGLLSFGIWRSRPLKCTAAPFLVLGLWGATHGARYDMDIAPTGDSFALRDASGGLMVVARHANAFAVEQWLSADGDGRRPDEVVAQARAHTGFQCDRLACVAAGPMATVSVIFDPSAFVEDCQRADIIVSALRAPKHCDARLVLDRNELQTVGAVALRFDDDRIEVTTARSRAEDRPWSPALRKRTLDENETPLREEGEDATENERRP